jgi:hypothetical protein
MTGLASVGTEGAKDASIGAGGSATASGLPLGRGAGGHTQKILKTAIAAEIVRLAVSFGVKRACRVDVHSTDGVFGRGLQFVHGFDSLPGCQGVASPVISWTLGPPYQVL